ncbi:MAG TPA: TonB family protein [Pyrinomonadaceae bacterium]|nr:TonB family protein [Pyrinomonadaceae bacterium]
MKSIPRYPLNLFIKTSLALAFLTAATCVRAQTPATTPTPTPVEPTLTEQAQLPTDGVASPAAAETDAAQKRLTRARSLAAIGRLAAAASELESLRASTNDDSVRDVARLLLMSIFVEMPDYTRAAALLDESFRARTPGQTSDAATHTYFALAGQTVISVRTHLERYRSFGVNVSDAADLPPEAGSDIEQLRVLLEKVAGQAKSLHEEQIKGGEEGMRGLDAAALLEDAATVRMRIARQEHDRAQWQTVVSEAREHLFSSEMRIASISELPAPRLAPAPAQPANGPTPSASAANKSAQSAVTQRTPVGEQKPSAKKSSKAGSSQKPTASSGAQTSAPAQQPAPQQPNNTQPSPTSTGGAKRSDGGPVSVGSLAGRAKQRVSPSYPTFARTTRVSGVVTVYLVVNEKGEVESVERADGPPQLQQAASDAARRWKFTPTVIDGQPVRVTGFLSFNFSL